MPAEDALLPPGFRISLDPSTRLLDDRSVLCGGAPFRMLRVTAAGRRVVDALVGGAEVPRASAPQRLVRRLLDAGMAHPVPGPAPFSPADVAVVVPTRDRPGHLARTLASLGEIGAVVVVDDGSVDAAATAAVAREHGAEVVRHDRSLGPGAARDTGACLTTTPLLAFVDDGCTAAAGWLEPLLAHFADPVVGAAAPRVRPTEGSGALVAYEEVRSPLDLGSRAGPVRPRSWVPYVPAAALVVRRTAFDEIGGFDASLRYGEDVDLVWRIGEAGWAVRYEPSAEIHHPARPDLRSWIAQRVAYGSSAAPLAARHNKAVAPLVVSAWSAVAWLMAGLGFRKAALGVAGVTTALLVPRLSALERPGAEAVRLGGLGHAYAGRAVADAVRRPWWPFALVAACVSRRARRGLAVAAVVPPVLEWAARRPRVDLVRYCALRIADDVSYGTGVWLGCARARSFAALIPDLASWPGRKPAVER